MTARIRVTKDNLVLMDMSVSTLSVMLCVADGKMPRLPVTVETIIDGVTLDTDEVSDTSELDIEL